ncbi:MAG TPA: glycosyltransferase family 39 protein [Bryobacteraceae bacterium]|nr:glycosyltransferase family 39 protein [Bryobacteraceae bacterium]
MTTLAHPRSSSSARQGRFPAIWMTTALAVLAAGLVLFSQTRAFAWDEGFHILTAQLILHGKRPYLDFVFSQTPLNAYWNAGWMALFGENWRVAHGAAALCSAAAMLLTARYVVLRFPVAGWRIPAATAAACLVGLDLMVVKFGTIAQAYGLCLLAVTAAYWFSILAVERRNARAAALAGLCCGIAAASSLLTLPAGPVMLVWLFVYGRGGRWRKCAAFLAGETAAFAPVFWLFAQGPRRVWFGIVNYNLLYRQVDWPGATQHNLEVITSWIDSGPALLLILLSAAGLLFVRFRSAWDQRVKNEFYLCAWLSAVLALYISSVRPTFPRYYMFAVPFLSILAVAGIYFFASRVYRLDRPWHAVAVLGLLLLLGLGKGIYDARDNLTWPEMEQVARKVNAVAMPGQALYADELTYFLTRHAPPSGMEMANSHKFHFTPERMRGLHLISDTELERQVETGVYGVLETCEDDDYIAEHGYAKWFRKSAEAGSCTVFWDWQPSGEPKR